MEKALGNLLLSNNQLYAIVGNRVSPIKRDQLPSATYEKISREEDINVNGMGSGIIRTKFIITSRAKTFKQAKLINEIIKATLLPPYTSTNPKIFLAVLEDEREDQLLEPDITEVILEYTFHHNAAY